MNKLIDKTIYEQLAEFRYQIRHFLHFSEQAARQLGLTPQAHQLMLAIMGFAGRDYATPSELAERLQLTRHACLGLINRCEAQGLVERASNPEDGRSILIRLTSKGQELLYKLSEIHLKELSHIQWGMFRSQKEDG
ncbi:MarR family winged helix-turn-helix transcriptional regulator [Paenibacillus hexagrammi]|uniref:MarR family transcriptional regulator n=1 Tax=Paenibacillus hexagrammi TaxID=2908839 RepID=A0ABY3SBY4_9BACL|nr:MarR family transcriptional regulator [Paenibacillus sp. YPD9-1]UJF31436.1 MarR family transcriptional regulator [Paenibacillus sp. YPD9-1]